MLLFTPTPPGCPGLLLTRHALRDRFFGGQFDKPGAKTGGVGYRNTVLRVYVDGEPTAAIEATIYNLHGFVFFCARWRCFLALSRFPSR